MSDTSANTGRKRNKLAICLWLGCGLAVVVFAYQGSVAARRFWGDRADERRMREADPLVISDEDLAIGELWETAKHSHHVKVVNRSNGRITVLSVTATCDCLQIAPSEDVEIAPGGSLAVQLTLNATITAKQRRTERGFLLAVPLEVRYATKDGTKSKEWLLTATLVPVLTVRTNAIDFGSRSILDRLPEQVVEVEAESFVKELRCKVSPVWRARIVNDGKTGTRSRFTITVFPAGPLRPRKLADTLEIIPSARVARRCQEKM
jgi:hypothetical protein